jgi:hypothetical protein
MPLLAVASAGQTAVAAGIAGVVYSEGSNERVVHASLGLWTVGGSLVAEVIEQTRLDRCVITQTGASSVQGANKERWRELCEQASVEQDPEKLLELTREINELLARKQGRLSHNTRPDSEST